MTPELREHLLSDPGTVEMVRLFQIAFGSITYFLNEGMTPLTIQGQRYEPTRGWFTADSLELSGDPFDASPAYYTVWGIDTLSGEDMARESLLNPAVWAEKRIRQMMGFPGFNDMLVLHSGRIRSVDGSEAIDAATLRIRAEGVASRRNYTPLGEYTPRDQARRYPGVVDRGMDYFATNVGKRIKGWLVG